MNKEFEHHTYDIYYDEEGDFLEITFGAPPENEYTDQVEEGVFITKDASSHEVRGIGILGFKKRTEKLREMLEKINFKLPLNIVIP